MAFSFNTSTSNVGFGAAAKPTFSFGPTTTTTAASGFGGFGTTTSVAPAFGGFGTATSTVAPFGGLTGAATTSAPSLFGGGGFGTTAAKPATGFGNTSFGTGSAFGTGQPTFGSTAPTFGSTAPTFGNTAPTFGSTAPTFGSSAPTFGTTAPTFGGSTFGTGSFGSAFGTKPATTGFGGFGTGLGTTSVAPFGQQQQQQQAGGGAAPTSAQEALVAAVFNCNVFGDERDQVLAKWNLLQAQWGTGQAYYSRNAPPLDLNEHNPLCRFKAVGYSKLENKDDKDGYVALQFNKSEQEVKTNKQTMTTSLQGLLGNKPNLTVTIDSIEPLSDNKTQITIYVTDSNASGARILASELGNFLNSGSAKMALNNGGCSTITPVKRPGERELTHYLNTPPPGMDMRLWKQAQADNPDSENFIPVPMIGFTELKLRSRSQSAQAARQAAFLRAARDDLESVGARRAAAAARLAALRATHHALHHTLLQIIGRVECAGRSGAPLTPEEEATRARLDELAALLAAPPLHNGRLNELLCAVRLQRSASAGAPQERYHLDPGAQEDMKQFLAMQQKGMAHLLDTAKKDLAALDTITEGMSRLVRG